MEMDTSLLKKFFGRDGIGPACCGDSGEKSETPLEVVEKRYAKGEIPKEEFQDIKKDLLEGKAGPSIGESTR